MESMIGHTLGQYQLIEQIGQGGMATVYKAYQPSLNRYVAIKVLPPYYAHDPGFTERFTREAQAIAQLEHPNILPVYDFGKQGDISYIVMKYVPAGTLRDKLGRPLPPIEAVRLIDQIAAALDAAHERGILHRDIKPGNMLIDDRGWIYLSDFGLAKMVEGAAHLTATGVGIGTPAYMSPEQGQGRPVNARTDVYALGVVLFEMLTGRVPYEADTPMAVVIKHVTDPIPLPRQMNPNIPEAVEQVLLKALAKNPDHRFASAGELAQALHHAVQRLEPAVAAAPIPPDPDATQFQRVPARSSAAPIPAQPVSPAKQTNWLPILLGLGALALLFICGGVGLFYAFNQPVMPPTPTFGSLAVNPTATFPPASPPTAAPPAESSPSATVPPPTDTPTPTPSPSATLPSQADVLPVVTTPPPPVCTPPPCAANEIYFCPGNCPGGCGVVCATVTPAPVTATFTPTPTPTATPTPRWADTGLRPAGQFASIWQVEADALGYPLADAAAERLCARQPFERGNLVWVDMPDDPNLIWGVVGDSPTVGGGQKWYRLVDDWPGSPDFWCPEAEANAPIGPRRGFGKQWCAVSGLRIDLGRALEEEKGGPDYPRCELQFFQGGTILHVPLDNAFLVLIDGGGWRRY